MAKQSKKKQIENGALTLTCTKCSAVKGIEEFYGDSLHCKNCHKGQVKEIESQKHLKFLSDCIEQGYMTHKDLLAASLLLDSSKSRFNACKYNFKGYERVKCDYDDYYTFFMQLISWKEFFASWKKQTLIFEQNKKQNSYRPVIDRIDELGNYTTDNIQCLSMRENTLKARQIASKAILMSNKGMACFEFSSKSHFVECLSEYLPMPAVRAIDFDTFQPQQISNDTYILLQTKNCKIDEHTLTNEPRFDLTLVYKRYFIDKETNEIAKTQVLGVERNPINRFVIK